ncbi:MAG: cation:proton antiporter [Acidimicrobiia bacterium]|nr:cation:proton antiporter [Acidimicrobiia bacterium]
MSDQPLVALATILLLGLLAQWLAWRLRVPSILLLLTFGLLAGPVSGVLDPDELLGDLLLPVVSLSVGVILFEGGLSLGLRELRQAGAVVRNLVTLGVVVTGGIGTAASLVLFDVDSSVAALIGAIVVVTGPTVIGPLLRQIRPVGAVGSVLRVEGILVDPIGALLAVLVFEGILADTLEEAAPAIGLAILETLVVGTVAGLLGAGLLVLVLKRYLVPDALHNALALGIVVAVFTGADRIQEESGLFAATVMGIALASQRITPVRHILEFSETLQILLISGLFIVLGARVETDGLSSVALGSVGLLAVLVLVARPLAVLVSTFRSRLGRRERLFLMAMAPRGIVAAAVSSIFAIRLTELGRPGADTLVPVTFLVVLGSIVIYGVAAPRVALRLGLSDPDPQGVLVVGAHRWARDIGSVLAERGVRVVMVDNDRANVVAARLAGFPSVYGSVLSDRALDEVDLGGIGRMLALTPNDEVNALAAQQFVPIFGRKNVFQLAPGPRRPGRARPPEPTCSPGSSSRPT